jgi:hypothetical protein
MKEHPCYFEKRIKSIPEMKKNIVDFYCKYHNCNNFDTLEMEGFLNLDDIDDKGSET